MGPPRPPDELAAELKSEAKRLGFAESGVCAAVAPAGWAKFKEWLERGYAGEMSYLADRCDKYAHPQNVLEGVRSIVVLAFPYRTVEPQPVATGQGRISRYAWGLDYHDVIHDRLHRLADFGRALAPQAKFRGAVDTAPLLEREFAQLAGLGWIGRNTLLLNKRLGSWFFLAALLTDLDLPIDEPFEAHHCGTCRACLDACPTQAFVEPFVLDARRCISYLTIELREPVPHDLRPGIGDWIQGCDVCQDVCPWNNKPRPIDEPALLPHEGANPVDLVSLFFLTDDEFRTRFRKTPLWRPRRRGVLRNAAIVLGNQRAADATPALVRGLHDGEPLVREASAWALGRIGGDIAPQSLRDRRAIEDDTGVLSTIAAAIAEVAASDGDRPNGGDDERDHVR